MKITVADALLANNVFQSEVTALEPMSIKVSLWFARNGRETSEIVKVFRENTRGIFKELAVPVEDDDGKSVNRIPNERMPEYEERVKALTEEEVDIVVHKISEEDFGDFKLSPKDAFAVLYAIE